VILDTKSPSILMHHPKYVCHQSLFDPLIHSEHLLISFRPFCWLLF